MLPDRPAGAASDRHHRAVADAACIGAIACALRIPALFAERHFHPDDGTYGMSALAMRDGSRPFATVFSSQGPLHLPLVWLGDAVTLRQTDSPRASSVAFGIATAVIAYLLGRRIGGRASGRAGGWFAGLALAATGSSLWTSGPITADAPTVAFVLGALLVSFAYAAHPRPSLAAAIGGLAAAAVLCKPAVAVLGLLPTIWVVVRARRGRDLLVAAGVAVAVGLTVTVPFGPADVWDQAVRYQLESERERSIGQNAAKVVTTLWSRDLVLLGAFVITLATMLIRRARRGARARDHDGSDRGGRLDAGGLDRGPLATSVLAVWLLAMTAFLVTQPALWRNHLAHLVAPIALFVVAATSDAVAGRGAARRGSRAVVIVGLVAGAIVQASFLASILVPPPYGGANRDAADALERLPESARVVSDEVGLVWRSEHRTPDDLVDMSIKQFQQGRIDLERLTRVAERDDVCAFLVWSDRHLGAVAGLPMALERSGYTVVEHFDGARGARRLWVKRDCAA